MSGPANAPPERAEVTTSNETETTAKSYEARAKAEGMRFTISDVPPLHMSVLFGFQHYFTMLGALVLIPLLVTPSMGATPKQTAEVISTIFFVTGINTLVQTTIGDRLPIVQGGSFAYLTPTFSIIFNPNLQAIEDDNERFLQTMQVVSGGILAVGLMQMAIGYSGIFVPMLKYISPVTIAPVIAAIGLGLYNVGFSNVAICFPVGLIQMFLTILFSQYLKKISIGGYPVFALFPIILSICLTWSYAAIMTAADVWDEDSQCRTDGARDIIQSMPFFRFPYPGQWGAPQFKSYAIIPMIGAMLASMIESVGDYYSCARLSGAPPPTPGIISRGLAGEGIGLLTAGLFGTASGTTSYSENIGAISLTRVGSRVVVQCGAIAAIVIGCLGKVSALFAALPPALTGGIYCVVFGLIVAVGLSNLQFINLNSERNLFIVGFAIFNSLSIAGPAGYFATQEDNPFGDSNAAEIAYAIFSSPMIIALISAMLLDNTIPGTNRDRGLTIWSRVRDADVNNDPEYVKVYSLPLCLSRVFHNFDYLEYPSRGSMPTPPENGYQPGQSDLGKLCCPCLMTNRELPGGDQDEEEMAE